MSLRILRLPSVLKVNFSLLMLGRLTFLVPGVVTVSILALLLKRPNSCLGFRVLLSWLVLIVGRLLFFRAVLVAGAAVMFGNMIKHNALCSFCTRMYKFLAH